MGNGEWTENNFQIAEEIFRAGVEAVEPRKLVRDTLELSGTILTVEGESYDLKSFQNVYLLGAGKSGEAMAGGVEDILGERITGGIIVTTRSTGLPSGRVPRRAASHPIPDGKGVQATEELISIAASAGPDDLVIVLLSGGGSALLSAPASGVYLDDIQLLTALLLRSGAPISELNTIRKHLSLVKGGGLARMFYPARVLTIILSDVVGDDPGVIASGPTSPDPTTFRDCLEILERYGIRAEIPSRIRDHLERGEKGMIPETPDGSDPVFQKVRNIVIGNNRLALQGAAEKARQLGYRPVVVSDQITGDTTRSARLHCALAAAVSGRRRQGDTPVCLISGGETTVVVKGTGRGGRNSEFVLVCARDIAGKLGTTVLSGGTDGIDAETPAAGAICDGSTVARGEALGMNADEFLKRNDSYTYFQALGELLITGLTGTNVMDLRIMLMD